MEKQNKGEIIVSMVLYFAALAAIIAFLWQALL